MKQFLLGIILYTSCGRVYQGMSVETVQALFDAEKSSCTFMTKEEFDADQALRAIAIANRPPPAQDPVKVQATIDAQNKLLDAQSRIDALIKAIDLK